MKKSTIAWLSSAAVVVIGAGIFGFYRYQQYHDNQDAQTVAKAYTTAFAKRQYTKMVQQVDASHLDGDGWHYTAKTLATRQTAVFDRVGASNIKISKLTATKQNATRYRLNFTANMDTKIGRLKPQRYHATMVKTSGKWRVRWTPSLIFPGMSGTDTVQLSTIAATRGEIYDRNHMPLAQNGKVIQAGLLPGKLGSGATRSQNLQKIAKAWDVKVSSLETLLKQTWVKDDTFVPIKIVTSTQSLTGASYQEIDSRTYPLGEAAAQLIGYVGHVTADDLKKNPSLADNGTIGKAGLEQTYNKRLAGTDGGILYLQGDSRMKILLKTKAKAGKNLTLTIDADQQRTAYTQLGKKAGSVVTMNPQNGQLLVLTSSPSYDPNKFVNGISATDYKKYASNKNLPFISRFAQRYAPGSTFKMLTAGIALQNGTITANTTKSISGLKWQKNSDWGSYQVTRTVDASPENMTQALAHSDNIWFAQVALQMGQTAYLKGLNPFFKTQADLPLTMTKSQISNSDHLDKETLLADTAYGQGQLLVSPIQQVAMYSAIANGGTMQQPVLTKDASGKRTSVLQASAANTVKTALTHVVSDATGTAHNLQIAGHTLAAKTGTAELKQKQDVDGKTNGFLAVMDADKNSYLTLSLMEDAGSADLVKAMKPYIESLY